MKMAIFKLCLFNVKNAKPNKQRVSFNQYFEKTLGHSSQCFFVSIKNIYEVSGRVAERGLNTMKSIYKLGLLLLGERCQPCFLILMDKQTEIMSNLASSVSQFDEEHPSVR